MKYIFVFFLVLTSFLYGCLWLSGTTLDGEYREFHNIPPSYLFEKSINGTKNEIFSRRFGNVNKYKESYRAVRNIMIGDTKKAIQLLLKIEKKTPNKYETATNLGVAYELDNNIIEALKWVKNAIHRNKNAHYGTEWLHQFILENKLKLIKNPNFFQKKHMIILTENIDDDTVIKIGNFDRNISEIRKALIYQIQERTVFIKPKDIIVSELFYTLAVIEAETRTVEEAFKLFNFARLYGFSDSAMIDKKIDEYNSAFIYFYIRYGLLIIFIILLVVYLQKYLKSKVIKNGENKIILNTFYSTVITIAILLAFSILGVFLYEIILNFAHTMNEPPLYVGAILGYSVGLFQISRYMKQKNYVVKNRFKTIVWSASILISIYLYLISLLYETWILPIVILYFLLLGLYLVLKKNLPIAIEEK